MQATFWYWGQWHIPANSAVHTVPCNVGWRSRIWRRWPGKQWWWRAGRAVLCPTHKVTWTGTWRENDHWQESQTMKTKMLRTRTLVQFVCATNHINKSVHMHSANPILHSLILHQVQNSLHGLLSVVTILTYPKWLLSTFWHQTTISLTSTHWHRQTYIHPMVALSLVFYYFRKLFYLGMSFT